MLLRRARRASPRSVGVDRLSRCGERFLGRGAPSDRSPSLDFYRCAPPSPYVFVNVASKGLRYCASSLFATHRRGLRSGVSKGLRLHKNCARGTVGRAVDPEGDRPLCSRKECRNPPDSKVLPERSWAEERARVRKSLILKDRKNAEEFSTARVMFTPAEGKEVEFRLMEKWTSEFKPDQQAKKPQM